eukprot:1392702-Amphidinium_carterae.1
MEAWPTFLLLSRGIVCSFGLLSTAHPSLDIQGSRKRVRKTVFGRHGIGSLTRSWNWFTNKKLTAT